MECVIWVFGLSKNVWQSAICTQHPGSHTRAATDAMDRKSRKGWKSARIVFARGYVYINKFIYRFASSVDLFFVN